MACVKPRLLKMKIDELEDALKQTQKQAFGSEQEKLATLAKFVQIAREALDNAQKFADEHALSFNWDDSYGSSKQTYLGRGMKNPDWQDSGCEWDDSRLTEGKWTSSSDGC